MTGYTLVELMIGMTLGLVIIAGLLGLYLALQEGSRIRAALSSQATSATFVAEAISYGARIAGQGGVTDPVFGTAEEVGFRYAIDTDSGLMVEGRDCLGRPVDSDTGEVEDRWFLDGGALRCGSTRDGEETIEVMTTGIDAFSALYRYQLVGGGVGFHEDPPSNEDEWRSVSAVRIAFAVAGNGDAVPQRSITFTAGLRLTP